MVDKKKKGLGRGLDALLEPYTAEPEKKTKGKNVTEIDIYSIDTNKDQPRKDFDADKLNELAESLKTHGIIQPLIVVQNGERFMIVAGERRFRAAKLAGLKTVPVIVESYDEQKLKEVSLIENIQRENLNPIEEAAAIRFLMQQHDLTQEEVSERLGRSRPAIANSLRLLQLPKSILEAVRSGEISSGHGRAIAGVSDKKLQEQLKDECIRLGYSVRALESRIRNLSEEKKNIKKVKPVQSTEIKGFVSGLHKKLSTKVSIDGDEKKGRIIIDYYSAEELENLYKILLGEE